MKEDLRFAWTPDVGIMMLILMLVFGDSARCCAFNCGRRSEGGRYAYVTGLQIG
jgi:hypothetical protein